MYVSTARDFQPEVCTKYMYANLIEVSEELRMLRGRTLGIRAQFDVDRTWKVRN